MTTRCTVAPTLVSVSATTTDPRLNLLMTWRADGGTRHVTFGSPVGAPGTWEAGDTIEGATEVEFTIAGRSADFAGPMRYRDQSLDEVRIELSC